MLSSRLLPAAALALLTACGLSDPDLSGVELTTDNQTYSPGATMEVTLRNGADEVLSYDLCLRLWSQSGVAGWIVAVEEPVVCARNVTTLEPGESISQDVTLPEGVTAGGTWRLDIHAQLEGQERDTLHSNGFTVQ